MHEDKLKEIDIEILDYISRFDEIHIDKILVKFPESKYSTTRRLNNMTHRTKTSDYHCTDDNHISQRYTKFRKHNLSTSHKETGYYHTTAHGNAFLQNYHREKHNQSIQNRKALFLKLAPIIISLVALAKSFEKEITLVWQLIKQLLK